MCIVYKMNYYYYLNIIVTHLLAVQSSFLCGRGTQDYFQVRAFAFGMFYRTWSNDQGSTAP